MKEHKTDMNITKIDKYKKTKQKLNSNSTMEHQTPEHYQIQKIKDDGTENRLPHY